MFLLTEDDIPPHDFNCHGIVTTPQRAVGIGGAKSTFSRNPDAVYSHDMEFIFPTGETVVAYVLEDEFRNVLICSIVVKVQPGKCLDLLLDQRS